MNLSRVEASAGLFAALGDKTRLRLVSRLCDQGPMSITELSEGVDITRQAVTKHLKVLEGEGLVHCNRQGREQIFELEAKRIEVAVDFLAMISDQWEGRLQKLKAFVEEN